MNERFEFITHGDLSLLVYRPWREQGIVHGMTLRDVSFRSPVSEQLQVRFYRAVGVPALLTPQQTHSDSFIDLRPKGSLERLRERSASLLFCEESDGVIGMTSLSESDATLAIGVTTADCVPVIVRSSQGWGVIHAGWRGLANGIIGKVVSALGDPREAVIFPSAGPGRYEVGCEVVDAIGPTAAHLPTGPDKSLLDTAETARNQLARYLKRDAVDSSGICTIADERFHSYRREGDSAGRSLTFVRL